MNHSFKVKVKPVLGTIRGGNGRGLIPFNRLSDAERSMLVTEAYQRIFMSEFLGVSSAWERVAARKKSETSAAELTNNMENEILQSVIDLATKEKTSVVVNECIGDRSESVTKAEKQEKKVKMPNATAQVAFSFDTKKSVLTVEIKGISVREEEKKDRYMKSLERALKNAADDVEEKATLPRVVKAFFDTLHVHKLCTISGPEALNMMRVYRNAMKVYPLFANLEYAKQIDILDKGYHKARTISVGSRDIHSFAKGTFEAMCEEKGLIDRVYKHDFITGKMMLYYKIGEHRRDRKNPDTHQIWERDSLLFVDYVYGEAKIRTSLMAFDLWDLLAKGARDESAAVC